MAKRKREFLFAEPGRARCNECGGVYTYPRGTAPLAEFIASLTRFYQDHKRCDKGKSPIGSFYPPMDR